MSHYALIQRRADRKLSAAVGLFCSCMATVSALRVLAICEVSADIVRILVTVN